MPKIIIIVLLLSRPFMAQQIDFQWAKQFECEGLDTGDAITTDANGNVYTTGVFSGTGDFNPGIDVFSLSSGSVSVFINKLGKNGDFKFAKCFSGTSPFNTCKSIAVDAAGNIYLTGEFRFTIDFSPGSGNNKLNTGGDFPNIYIVKLDSSGNFVWSRQLGNSFDIYSNSLTTDDSGNVYFTGFFAGVLDFDSGPGIFEMASGKNGSIYVAKLNTEGKFLWAKQFSGTTGNYGWSVDVDIHGNVYTSGPFCGTVDFDPGPDVFNLVHGVDCFRSSSFICKLDRSGNFLWAKQIVNGGLIALALDQRGNVYFCGSFRGTIDFDPGLSSHLVSASPLTNYNGFICMLDPLGDYRWVKTLSSASTGTPGSRCNSLDIDKTGNIFYTGRFNGTTDFDPGAGTYTLSSPNGIFIAGLDSSANFWFAKSISGYILNGYSGRTIASDKFKNIYCTGIFANTPDGGEDSLKIHSPNNYGAYIIKLGPTILDTLSSTTFITPTEPIIYPNPTTGGIRIMFSGQCDKINVTDIAGKFVYASSEVTHKELSLDLSEHASGLYLCSIITGGKTYHYKILKLAQ